MENQDKPQSTEPAQQEKDNAVQQPQEQVQAQPQTAVPQQPQPQTENKQIENQQPSAMPKSKIPKKALIVGLIGALLVIIGAVIVIAGLKNNNKPPDYVQSNVSIMPSSVITPAQAVDNATDINTSDTSNSALQQDLNKVDVNIGSVDSNMSEIDKGLNDQPEDIGQ